MRTVRQVLESKNPEVHAVGPDAPVIDAVVSRPGTGNTWTVTVTASEARVYVEAVVKGDQPGRNDACSCGSGKKFKKCCG